MTDAVKAIDELELSEDDRLMREAGFEDSNGKMTEDGEIALTRLLWKTHRDELIKKLRAVKAAEKTDKKGK